MACTYRAAPALPSIGITNADFDAVITAGPGVLTYDSGASVWVVTPKPSAGETTVRFTPKAALTVTNIKTFGRVGSFAACDGFSTLLHFAGGTPSDIAVDSTTDYDSAVSGIIGYVDLTYQDTVAGYTGIWQIGEGQIEFEVPAVIVVPQFLVIANWDGTILHTQDISDLTTGTHTITYTDFEIPFYFRPRIYTTDVFPDLVKLVDLACGDPYWAGVVLSLDGTDFIDKSSYATAITNTGVTISGGMYQCNATGQLDTTTNYANFDLWAVDSTIEFFMLRNSTGYGAIFGQGAGYNLIGMGVAGPLKLSVATAECISVAVPSADVEHHIAFTHRLSDRQVQCFIDGVLVGTGTATGTPPGGNNFTLLGEQTSGAAPQLGYGGLVQVRGLRFTRGVIRYTDTFDPPVVFDNSVY